MRTRSITACFAIATAMFLKGPLCAAAGAWPQQPTPPGLPVQPSGPVRDPGGRPGSPSAAPGKAILAGSVTASTGQPVVGARVSLSGPDSPGRTTTTDARGQFTFEGLKTGRYYVSVSKPGHVSLTYGQRRVGGAGTAIPLDDGERRDIQMQLPRGAVITGMILDERGEPSINTSVRGMRYTLQGGRRRAQQVAGDETDDRGIYRLHSLQPGEYAVCAVARNFGPMNDAQRLQMEMDSLRRSIENAPSTAMREQMAQRLAQLQAQRVEPSEPAMGYAPVCFPSVSPTAATTVAVAAGEERAGVDIQMILTPVARVEGTVVQPAGMAVRNVQLTLGNADDTTTDVERRGAGTDPNGRFSFQNVPPGRYLISARTMTMGPPPLPGPGAGAPPKEPLLWASADVTVAGQDVSGVVLELQRGLTISGQVTFQPTSLTPPSDASGTQISMVPALPDNNMLTMGPPPQAKVDSSGRFTISDVVPGRYRFSAGVLRTQAWVVDSITVSGQDALDTPLDVKNRDVSGVVVTFGDRETQLSGTIANQKGEPATEQTILLYATDPKYWTPNSRRIRTVRAGADGHYLFRMVPPGEYRLTTLDDPEPGTWFDRELLEQLDSSSVHIVLAEGEKRVEHVRIR